MLYRKIPKNEDELSILGFGCLRLPTKEDGTIDEKRAISRFVMQSTRVSTMLIRPGLSYGKK